MAAHQPILDIAVINDKQTYAETIVRDLRRLGCQPNSIVAPTTIGLYQAVRAQVVDQEKQFDGVVLDIMFADDPLGGVKLWKQLAADGLNSLMGSIMLLTNTDRQDDVMAYFDSINQPIVVLSGATGSERRRTQDLQLFIEQIRQTLG